MNNTTEEEKVHSVDDMQASLSQNLQPEEGSRSQLITLSPTVPLPPSVPPPSVPPERNLINVLPNIDNYLTGQEYTGNVPPPPPPSSAYYSSLSLHAPILVPQAGMPPTNNDGYYISAQSSPETSADILRRFPQRQQLDDPVTRPYARRYIPTGIPSASNNHQRTSSSNHNAALTQRSQRQRQRQQQNDHAHDTENQSFDNVSHDENQGGEGSSMISAAAYDPNQVQASSLSTSDENADEARRKRNREYARQSRERKRREFEALQEYDQSLRQALGTAERQISILQETLNKARQELDALRQASFYSQQEQVKLRERLTRSEYDCNRLHIWIQNNSSYTSSISAPPPPTASPTMRVAARDDTARETSAPQVQNSEDGNEDTELFN